MIPSLKNPNLRGRPLPEGGYAGDQAPYDAMAFSSELDAYLQYVKEQIAKTNASSFLTRASATVWNAFYSYPAKAAYLEGIIKRLSDQGDAFGRV
jgi:cytochrome c556